MAGPQQQIVAKKPVLSSENITRKNNMCMSHMQGITVLTGCMTGGTKSGSGIWYGQRTIPSHSRRVWVTRSTYSVTRSPLANIRFPIIGRYIPFRTFVSSSGALSFLPPTPSPADVSSCPLSRLHPARAPESAVLWADIGKAVTVFVFVTASACESRSCWCITLDIP
jgi:hypothetical protein